MIPSFVWEISVLAVHHRNAPSSFFKTYFNIGKDLNLKDGFNSIFI